MAFTLIYALIALVLVVGVAVIAFLWRGWKAALLAAVITIFALGAGLFVLINLITLNM